MKSDNDLISASLDACKFTDRHISDDIGRFKYVGPRVDDGTALSVSCNHGGSFLLLAIFEGYLLTL